MIWSYYLTEFLWTLAVVSVPVAAAFSVSAAFAWLGNRP